MIGITNFMSEQIIAHAGATVLIGAPAHPMSESRLSALRGVFSGIADVAFVYIPNIYIKGQIDPPRQVLYLVFHEVARTRVKLLMKMTMRAIQDVLPTGEYIDAIPAFIDHEWLADVMATQCLLVINDRNVHDRCLKQARL